MDFVWYLRVPDRGCVLIYDRTVVRWYRRRDDGIVEERRTERRCVEEREGNVGRRSESQKGGWRAITLAVSRFDLTVSSLALFFCMFSRDHAAACRFFAANTNTTETHYRDASPASIQHARREIENLEEARAERSLRRARRETNVTWWCMRNPFCNRNRYRDVSTQPRTGLLGATSTDFRPSARNLAA